ncbi:alkaline phosphatase family protein [Uliginosibacterium sp. H1]|uniref:alkaline phosphatase family protein n=1 Tax=Uliginosibacterium sp. H1 TaxID=3114757 RepID=UPI002E19AA82|nr:alkaline phosphatase family protein [Uliginosibacterium sp. H1]
MDVSQSQRLQAALAPLSGVGADYVLPDYAGRGLFNLAVSLARVCGASVPPEYADLLLADGRRASAAWERFPTLVFFLVDGMGDLMLHRNRDVAPNLWRHRQQAITSVFPSTTATAITTLMTAEPAAVHGLLGWFVRDERSGQIVAPLPMRHRTGGPVTDTGIVDRLLRVEPMLARARRKPAFVTLPELAEGPYARRHGAAASVWTYPELTELTAAVMRAVNGADGAGFVYAYTPLLDATAHDHGIDSAAVREVLARVDQCFVELCERLPQALVVATADHGFIDCPESRCIDLAAHRQLYAMLRAPLSGERRAAYCHVKPQYVETFGAAVMAELGHAVLAVRTREARAAGLFGPGVPVTVEDPAGDWILIARDDWTVRDVLPGENAYRMIGVHGGLTPQEMRVPLVVREPAD